MRELFGCASVVYHQTSVSNEVAIILLAVGIPTCAARLWWIWWKSFCVECGLEHSVCVCPVNRETMRPRR